MSNSLKYQVRDLYKKLLFLGREYPSGYENFFRPRLKAAFMKNRDLKNHDEIKEAIDKGEYVIRELEALYYLRKYRSLKRSYYNEIP